MRNERLADIQPDVRIVALNGEEVSGGVIAAARNVARRIDHDVAGRVEQHQRLQIFGGSGAVEQYLTPHMHGQAHDLWIEETVDHGLQGQ